MIRRGNCRGHIHRVQNPVDQHVLLRVFGDEFGVIPRPVLVLTPSSAVDVHILTCEVDFLMGVHGGDFHQRVGRVIPAVQVEVILPGLRRIVFHLLFEGRQATIEDLTSSLIFHHKGGGQFGHRLVIDLIKITHRSISRRIYRGKHD
jgi:hypothetical protein